MSEISNLKNMKFNSPEEICTFLKQAAMFYQRNPKESPSFEDKKIVFEKFVMDDLTKKLLSYISVGSFSGHQSSSHGLSMTTQVAFITGYKSMHTNFDPLKNAYDYVIDSLSRFIKEDIIPTLENPKKTKSNPNPKAVDLLKQTGICWTSLEYMSRNLNLFWGSYVERYTQTVTPKPPRLPDKISEILDKEFFEKIKDRVKVKVSDEINLLREEDWLREDSTKITFVESERYNFLKQVKELFQNITRHKSQQGSAEDTYNICIEQAFLTSLAKFYEKKQESWATTLPIVSPFTDETYLNKAFAAITLERARCMRCLSANTIKKLDKILVGIFIGPKKEEIVDSCLTTIFQDLFSYDRFDSAGASTMEDGLAPANARSLAMHTFEMLSLHDESPSKDALTKIGEIVTKSAHRDFHALIGKFKGEKKLDLAKPEKDTKEKLYSFFTQFALVYVSYEMLLDSIFVKNIIVGKSLARTYGLIAQIEPKDYFNKVFCDSLAVFLDCNLTKSKLKVTLVSDEVLLKLLSFAAYIDNKVEFFAHLQSQLFYRITDDNYEDLDKERTFNSKLVATFGMQMTVKIIRLLQSLTESQVFSSNYVQRERSEDLLELNPLILDAGVVVKQKRIEPAESPCMMPFLRSFESLTTAYSQQYKERKLDPLYSLGTCDVKCTFWKTGKKVDYTCGAGVLQAIYLTAFSPAISGHLVDSEGYLKFSDLDKLVQIWDNGSPDNLLQARIIFSLVRPKLLIHKLSAGVEVKEGNPLPKYSRNCRVKANPDYKNETKRFKIPSLKLEFSDKLEIKDEIYTLIDSAVVRVMKSRRTLKINELSAEVQQQLLPFYKFNDNQLLKRRYESLIEREFIKRDDDDNTKFIYLP